MQLKTISYDKEKERGAQIKLYRNSNEGHFQQGWEWKAWQKSKLVLEELGPKEKTIPVQGTHKLKDRILEDQQVGLLIKCLQSLCSINIHLKPSKISELAG